MHPRKVSGKKARRFRFEGVLAKDTRSVGPAKNSLPLPNTLHFTLHPLAVPWCIDLQAEFYSPLPGSACNFVNGKEDQISDPLLWHKWSIHHSVFPAGLSVYGQPAGNLYAVSVWGK